MLVFVIVVEKKFLHGLKMFNASGFREKCERVAWDFNGFEADCYAYIIWFIMSCILELNGMAYQVVKGLNLVIPERDYTQVYQRDW